MTVEIVERARAHGGTALTMQATGRVVSHHGLVSAAERVAHGLLDGRQDLDGARIAWLVPPGVDAVAILWGIWLAGGIAVPLALSHPRPELQHVVEDADADVIIVTGDLHDRVEGLADHVALTDELLGGANQTVEGLPDVGADRGALIVYTSGSTGRPKGALWTHGAIVHQVRTMATTWGWRSDDVALLLLPIHHVHGLINVLTCGLWIGGTVVVADGFDPVSVWDSMVDITVLMAVPTIYHRLLAAHEVGQPDWRNRVSDAARRLRLMVSGSAALPVSVLERWAEVTGHTLLERYGMTEVGMALTNPYDGPRRAGTVGRPFPGVEVRVVDDSMVDVGDDEDGQLLVRSPGMFSGYWRRPDATAAAFHDGWFLTGDTVQRSDGVFRVRGRMSVDIIKTGGFKVSALEIEEVVRTHAAVADCAVIGLPDDEWGEVIGLAIVVARAADGTAATVDEAELGSWMRDRLADYKVPRRIRVLHDLPRNALGKVVKPRVRDEGFGAPA